MTTVRDVMRSMARATAFAAIFAAAAFAMVPAVASAQRPVLQIVGISGAQDINGAEGDGGAATFPAAALSELGADISTANGAVIIEMFGETLRFLPHSPFFTVRDSSFQLAFAAQGTAAALALPEQFFIQFLPAHFAASVEYRDGALRVKNAVAATATRASASPGKRIVVIDPGHGGVDSGASGPNGLEEKNVCLMISTRLAALLRTRGYEVHMTRTTDTLISLADRPRFANQWKGDEPGALYISIHNNSLKTAPSAHGYETFFLADANTSDERRVADMENASIKFEKSTRPVGTGLDQVLNGLRNDFYLRASNAFADVVQKGLSKFHPGPNRGVKRAGFRVLIGALMPAVLVEVGFISNPQEAALLGSASFQDKIAYSLAESVDSFFRDNEPLWVKQ
jgi:N-acetylmuramoyl-L-alanine amidase